MSGGSARSIRRHSVELGQDLVLHDQKVNFSTFDGKLTFQCTRNGFQNHPFCPGSIQDTFIISSISHHQIFQKYSAKKTNIENRKSGALTFFTPTCATCPPLRRQLPRSPGNGLIREKNMHMQRPTGLPYLRRKAGPKLAPKKHQMEPQEAQQAQKLDPLHKKRKLRDPKRPQAGPKWA